jgi:hypothetical protein
MVPDVEIHLEINREIEMYWDGNELFGFEYVVAARVVLMPRKSLECRS